MREHAVTKLGATGRILLLAVIYYGAARIGMAVPVGNAHVSPVWPPAGVALAALLVFGWRVAPGIWLGAFMIARHAGFASGVAAVLGASNTAEAVASACLLLHVFRFDAEVARVRDVLALGGVALGVSTVAAIIGSFTLCTAGLLVPTAILPTAVVWSVGDTMGALVVAPVMLTLATSSKWRLPGRSLEASALGALLVVVSAAVFGSSPSSSWTLYSQAFLVFPFALWAALRFGPRGAALSSFAISAISIVGTSCGCGPFAALVPVHSVVVLQLFMATLTLTSLLLAAVSAERNRVQTRLAIAERMATVGTLAAGVAHEINTPLGFVIANLHGIARRFEAHESSLARTDELRRAVSEALEGAERIRLIVGDLKTLSRDTRDDWVAVDVDGVVRQALGVASHVIRDADVVQELGGPPLVLASEGRLGQVILNLLVNASDAIANQPERREIRVRSGVDGGRVFVEVCDSGTGIPTDVRPHIFEPFFTTKSIGDGTGLGLSIAREIVSSHGGEIVVDSVEGRGTTVRVLLPAAPSGARERKSGEPARVLAPHRRESTDLGSTEARPAEQAHLRRGRVLVVDDEVRFGNSLRLVLEPEYEVTLATGGEEALRRILSGETFDVILCDLHMPRVSGMDVHAKLLEAAPIEAAKMIFLSGGAITTSAQEFVEQERHRVLEKPVSPEVLCARLTAAIDRSVVPTTGEGVLE